ncbi:MAG: hypothetical protein LBG29_07420 [Synergistaceae bacterium]|jgi:hypothetical protein|nr:hypothetical protein [Synergistaceae bacterium]
MEHMFWFIGGALWMSLFVTFFAVWAILSWKEERAAKDHCINYLENKYRIAVGILNDRDRRAA